MRIPDIQQNLIAFLRRTSLKRRLVIGMLAVSILPATVLFTVMSVSFYSSTIQNYHERADQTAGELQSRAELFVDTMQQHLNTFASSTETVKTLRKLELSDDLVEQSSLKASLRTSMLESVSKGTSRMRVEVLDRDGDWVAGIFDNYFPEITQQARSFAVSAEQRMALWCGRSGASSVIVFSREIINFYNGQRIGWVLLYLDAAQLENAIFAVQTADIMVFYDAAGQLICATPGDLGRRLPEEDVLDRVGTMAAGNAADQWDAVENYRVLLRQSRTLGWTAAVFLDAGELNGLIWRLAFTAGSIYLIALGVIIGVGLVITQSVTHPVEQLEHSMQRFSRGKLSARVADNGGDELTVLATKFNAMASSIEHLTKDVYEAQIKEKEATLRALEAQMNPHFLYNTLDMVNWMAYRTSNQDVCRIVRSLSGFFRLGLNHGKEMYTVADELRHVQCYITIEEYAKTQVTFTVSADPRVLEIPCPKLIAQPLVENALVHGLEPRHSQGCVDVRFSLEEETVVIRVRDDGVGLSAPAAGSRFQSSGYGLNNIRQRLKMIYGEAGTVELRENETGGALAEVRFPAKPRKEGTEWN